MARNGLRTRPPGVDPRTVDGDGRRIPFVSIPRHTLILLALASAQYSLPSCERDGVQVQGAAMVG
jgi:hypothetical protein